MIALHQIFVLTFWACRKNRLIRKIRSISKSMTSQPVQQRFTTQILFNTSRIKGNQRMKFGQLVEHPKRNISLQILCRKWGRETSSRPLFVFSKSFIFGKSKWSAAWFHYILIALKLVYNSSKLFKALHYWSRDMVNFDFLDKGLGIVYPAHFVYDFSTKMFIMLYSIADQISLPGFLYFLRYCAICVLHCNCLLTRLSRHGFWN